MALEARELEWEFVPGSPTRAWGYNGATPGPVIEAKVGDVLEIRLKNYLPEPTMIHWHGLRLPPPMDGTENVQRPVPPGGTFVYRFSLLDAGTFWYHPHINETVQLERGLTGALIVRDRNEPQLDVERVLVIDDLALDRKGNIKPTGAVDRVSQRARGQYALSQRQEGARDRSRGWPNRTEVVR